MIEKDINIFPTAEETRQRGVDKEKVWIEEQVKEILDDLKQRIDERSKLGETKASTTYKFSTDNTDLYSKINLRLSEILGNSGYDVSFDYPDEYTTYHRVIVDWTSDEEKKCQKKNKIQAVFMCILLLSLLTIFYFIVRFLAL
jgi:hypothetical protein